MLAGFYNRHPRVKTFTQRKSPTLYYVSNVMYSIPGRERESDILRLSLSQPNVFPCLADYYLSKNKREENMVAGSDRLLSPVGLQIAVISDYRFYSVRKDSI